MSAATDPMSAAFLAIEARLRTYFLPTHWDFHFVPDPMSLEEFRTIVRRTPLLALAWRQFMPGQNVGRRFQGEMSLRLTIAVKHPLERGQRFLGDARAPGLFQAIGGAVALLNGFSSAGLGTFSVTGIGQAFAEGYGEMNIAIGTIDIGCTVAIGDVTGALASAEDFLRLLNNFEPWPDGRAPDDIMTVRAP